VTISLEQLADGSVSDRNFQKLMSLVPDTGGQSAGIRFGTVAANGAIIRGQGFTVTKGAAGIYTVNQTWTTAPVVLVAVGSTGGALAVKVSTDPSTAGFGVTTYVSTSGANLDSMFHWLAIG
jgi:hypothetical protein